MFFWKESTMSSLRNGKSAAIKYYQRAHNNCKWEKRKELHFSSILSFSPLYPFIVTFNMYEIGSLSRIPPTPANGRMHFCTVYSVAHNSRMKVFSHLPDLLFCTKVDEPDPSTTLLTLVIQNAANFLS